MAPTAPLGRERAIELVREGSLPIHLGSPHPSVLILQQEGRFRIRELVIDQEAAQTAASSARRQRSPSWMPEHYYALGKPTGEIFVEAASIAELAAAMATMAWPAHW